MTTLTPEQKAIEARRASAAVRQTAGRLAASVEGLEQRAAVLTSAERRRLLARAANVIFDAARTLQDAEKRIPPTAPAIYLVSIRQETTSIMNTASMAVRRVAGPAYSAYYHDPLALARAIAADLRMMGGTKPKSKAAPARARKSDEEEQAANEQTCPTCGQNLPADTDEEDEANNIGGPSRSSHRHWTTHNIAIIARKSADGSPMVRIAASSNAIDLEEDQFQLSSLREMRDQFAGKLIFHNHKYSVPTDVFGVVEKTALRERGGLTFLDLDVKVATENPVAVTTYNMIAGGVRLGVSVGVLIREAERRKDEKGNVISGLNILHVLALEASIVGIPANQTAWTQGTKRLRGAALREAREMMAIKS